VGKNKQISGELPISFYKNI